MSSICRIISKSGISCVRQYSNKNSLLNVLKRTILNPLVAYVSDTCGSDNKGSDPCDPCQPSHPSVPTEYDKRKFGHSLPCNNVNVCFEPLPHIPTGIFRPTDNEVLGLGAGKMSFYKNPEYFSYQHMSYYDIHLILRPCRQPAPDSKRKPYYSINTSLGSRNK